jgi:CheY-like chemotaxis protein
VPSPQSQKQPLILVVEEETVPRQAIVRHLQEAGFRVAEAPDTDAALGLLEGGTDIGGLVTDAHVPGAIEGYALADRVRKRWPSMAVIMTSGHSDASSGPLPEGSEFVAKPYLFSQLVPALNRLIGRAG